jgi:homoserine dehydrogenase
MIKIGLLGFGTVGSGVYEIINNSKGQLKESTGQDLYIEKILVRDIEKYKSLDVDSSLLTVDPSEILNNPDIDLIVEVMGGIEPAFSYMKSALSNGKHLVTANKAVVSKHLEELSQLAQKNDRGFLFEASVGGGIPIIKSLKESIQLNNISSIKGILNGTTNFILSKMYDNDLDFDAALKLAQEYGYAEADPTSDVEGHDAARKVAILSSLAFKVPVDFDDVSCSGITSISPLDIGFFKDMGLSVKLVGSSIFKDNQMSASVEPVLVDESSPFASVKDAFNIVSIVGDTVGELQFYGQGAGKKPTGNAVVSDIIDILKNQYDIAKFSFDSSDYSMNKELLNGKYYVRFSLPSKNQAVTIMDKLDNHNLKCEVLSMDENLVLITEKLSAPDIERITSDIGVDKHNLCYARIES